MAMGRAGTGERRKAEEAEDKPAESIQVRADPAWIAELKAMAKRMGLSASGFVRVTMTREMDRLARRTSGRP